MKIKEYKTDYILFDNGKYITDDYTPDCCEYNYADYSQLEEDALKYEFEEPLDFEEVEYGGFRFGNKGKRMFYIPCYSVQNGYYSTGVEIYYGNEYGNEMVLYCFGECLED